jgi:hypothetical protein
LPAPGNRINRGAGHWYARRANIEAFALLGLVALAIWAVAMASAGPEPGPLPTTTQVLYSPGKIVPIPASIPHEAGDMVDRRIVPDLLWIAQRYPIYVTDGYSGPLPSGKHVGCDECHVHGSDHYNGLAVDLVPLHDTTTCDANWAPITRLAHWAEPVQNQPILPFRWVGYEGDAGHGCGNHLHLSWNHSTVAQFQLAEWVETFPVSDAEAVPKPHKQPIKQPAPSGPPGGFSKAPTGGISPRGSGD